MNPVANGRLKSLVRDAGKRPFPGSGAVAALDPLRTDRPKQPKFSGSFRCHAYLPLPKG
jgi:hypothetical protein